MINETSEVIQLTKFWGIVVGEFFDLNEVIDMKFLFFCLVHGVDMIV
jgi:hypothetical protein